MNPDRQLPPADDSKLLSIRNYCDRCLGRIFSNVSTGLTNEQRGAIARSALAVFVQSDLEFSGDCEICSNIFEELEKYRDMCISHVEGYEFSTFRIGSIFSEDIIEHEQSIHESMGLSSETVKKEFNRELGKMFSDKIGVEYEMENSEMEITVDTRYDTVRIRPAGIFIYGTYRKLVRGIPQTRWIHGSGDTVESIIGECLQSMVNGENYYLHGAGREDVDVRMLGNGREFIIEVSAPRFRHLNLREFRSQVNSSGKVSIHNVSLTAKQRVKELKLSRYEKTYEMRIGAETRIDAERLDNCIRSLNGKVIYQRTPLRVSRRRADMVRERRLLESSLISTRGNTAKVRVRAEAGTYIKELVSGDHGRTTPSLASEYGEDLSVIELDVKKIHR